MLDSARLLRGFGLVTAILFATLPLATVAAAAPLGTPVPQQAGAGIIVSPPVKQLTLGPGLLQAQTHVSVKNNTGHLLNATINLVDFKNFNQPGGLILGQIGIPLWKYGLANWMSLPASNSLALAPGQSTDVEVAIQNRADLTPGGHYGAVVVAAGAPVKTAGSNMVSFSQNLVSLLFVKKLGGEHYGLQLQSLTADNGYNLPKFARLDFRSTGNVYVTPRGYVEVTDPRGKLVEKGIINQSSTLIMQDTSQQLVTALQPVASPDLSGKYKVTAYYRYEGQDGFNSKSLYFKHGPWSPGKILTTVAVVLGITIIILFIHRMRRAKK